ncbi:TetR family transcriptional regulator [Streptomyces sp. NPDC008125]|uniref:TetR family transcriptional regulator n=1 Tax=Streptomyces sp. NPDC008125 TaxID=3364811 RepID=UPI0036E00F24
MQERAARTRQALIRAAAREFDHHGYAAASLARISRAAGTSVGAVTFHFASKAELADAVHAQGVAETRHALQRVGRGVAPLQTAFSMASTVVRCLEDDVAVRAAARLDRDRETSVPNWTAVWSGLIQEELAEAVGMEHHASATPSIRQAAPSVVLALVVYLVHGAEMDLRQQLRTGTREVRGSSVSDLFTRIWTTLLPAVERPTSS